MKTCNKCNLDLEDDQFNIKTRKNGLIQLQPYCRECQKLYWKNYYSTNQSDCIKRLRTSNRNKKLTLRKFVDEYKNKPCIDCKQSFPSYVMDFDHIDKNKVASVSTMVSSLKAKDKIIEELNKCELVCSNCHRIRTHKRLSGIV